MLDGMTICVGTIGGGVHVSRDGGDRFKQIFRVVPFEGNFRALRVDPTNPQRVWGGSDSGLFRSDDAGAHWQPIDSPANGRELWSVGVDPTDGDKVYVGARPGGFRSLDGGESWEEMPMGVAEECFIGHPRTTNMVVDPRDPASIWAGIEIDGVHRSRDHGATWSRCTDLGPNDLSGDVHGLAIRPNDDGSAKVFAGGPFGLSVSTDEGESWELHQYPGFGEGLEHAYCRGVMIRADDPNVVFVGSGDTIPGEVGGIQMSTDGGETWNRAELPETPNSVVYWMANHPDRPEMVAAASLYGQLYLSDDGGEHWEIARRRFGEIRSLAITPSA